MAINRDSSQGFQTNYKKAPIGASLSTAEKPELNKIFVGIIKDNTDIQRMGRLRVFIPELGGVPSDRSRWITVSYCSPFAGASDPTKATRDGKTDKTNQHAYGFWMVPPDLENLALVAFINGEQNRGVCFGFLYQENMNHSVPGIASTKTHQGNVKLGDGEEVATPGIEYNKRNVQGGENVYQNPVRARFTPLHTGLQTEGLYSDRERGPSSASARRDATPQVYGFKTPRGHHLYIDDGEIELDQNGKPVIIDQQQKRKENANEYIRLRTRSGAQILINDTNGYIYANTKDGDSWVELADNGVHIYTAHKLNMRAERGINMHTDSSFNINVGGDFNVRTKGRTRIGSDDDIDIWTGSNYKARAESNLHSSSGDQTRITSGSQMNVKAGGTMAFGAPDIHHNTFSPASAAIGRPKPRKGYPDNRKSGPTTTNTIVTQMPHHEPWPEHIQRQTPPTAAEEAQGGRAGPDEFDAGEAIPGEFQSSSCASILAQKYESGGNPAAIGFDKVGGFSYGSVQIAARVGSMGSFLDYAGTADPEIYEKLQTAGGESAATAGSDSFKNQWKQLAQEDPERFDRLQKDWNYQSNFGPVISKMQNDYGIDLENEPTLRSVLYSQSTHMGPSLSNNVIDNALGDIPPEQISSMNREEVINRLYDERFKENSNGEVAYWRSSTPAIQDAMRKRDQRERRDALALLQKEQAGDFPCKEPSSEERPGAPVSEQAATGGTTQGVTPGEVPQVSVAGEPSPEVRQAIQDAADETGVSYEFMMGMAYQESTFNPNAKAGTSSATGLYQFIDGTWGDMVNKYGDQYGLTPDGRTDPRQSAVAGALFAKENGDFLRSRIGREPTPTDLYAAHFLGRGGAGQLLSAPGNAVAANVAKPAQVRANRAVFYNRDGSPRTVDDVYRFMQTKVEARGVAFAEKFPRT